MRKNSNKILKVWKKSSRSFGQFSIHRVVAIFGPHYCQLSQSIQTRWAAQRAKLAKDKILLSSEYTTTKKVQTIHSYHSHSTLRIEGCQLDIYSWWHLESRRYMRNMKIQPNTLLPEQFGGGYISSYQFYNQFHGGFCAPYICNPNYMLIVDFR